MLGGFDDAAMRLPAAYLRLRSAIEVVPAIHEFVPERRRGGRKYVAFALGCCAHERRPKTRPMQRFAGGLTRRQFFAIVCLFWLYVALSNVLYAYSMRTGIAT